MARSTRDSVAKAWTWVHKASRSWAVELGFLKDSQAWRSQRSCTSVQASEPKNVLAWFARWAICSGVRSVIERLRQDQFQQGLIFHFPLRGWRGRFPGQIVRQ